MTIERMNKNHIVQLAEIEKACFSSPWSAQAFTDELQKESSVFFAACENSAVLGYAGLYDILGDGFITNVAVRPECRRCGTGLLLVQVVLNYAKAHRMNFVTLEVRKSNSSAIRLYEKAGFQVVGERKNFYTRPMEDALLMTKEREQF